MKMHLGIPLKSNFVEPFCGMIYSRQIRLTYSYPVPSEVVKPQAFSFLVYLVLFSPLRPV